MAKVFETTAATLVATFNTNANLYTLAVSDVETGHIGGSLRYEVSEQAIDFVQSNGMMLLSADGETIASVSPDYKPYLEEGCQVAFLSESTSIVNRDKVINIMKSELADYDYYLTAVGGKYYCFAVGTSNATETQFYTPDLTTSSDIKILTLWD